MTVGTSSRHSSEFLCGMNFTGIADTRRRRSPPAKKLSEAILSTARLKSNVLATTTEFYISSVRLQPSPCAYIAHLFPNLQFPERVHSSGCQLSQAFISFWTIFSFVGAAGRLVLISRRTFPFLDPCSQGNSSRRAGRWRPLSLSFWVLARALPLSIASNLQSFFSLDAWTCPWLQQRQRRAFQIKKCFSQDFWSRYGTAIF